jgi:hypothetical protein
MPVAMLRVIPALLFASMLLLCGCDRSSTRSGDGAGESSAEALTLPAIPAKDYLQKVFERYRNTRAYRDEGEVVLRVEQAGQLLRQSAPMHVVFNGNQIWIAAYDARLWSDGALTVGWIADPNSDFHDAQVVVGGSAEETSVSPRPQLDFLLQDPLLTTRMTSGLGGPPPQLEWLLDADPMAKLFDNTDDRQRIIEYEGLRQRNGVTCAVVRAHDGQDTYRFWVDRVRSLIHTVELPIGQAEQFAFDNAWKIRSLELTLSKASFEPPAEPYTLDQMPKSDFPPSPRFVGALVPLPPQPPHQLLGTHIRPFAADPVSGRTPVTESAAAHSLTLFASFPRDETDNDSRQLAFAQSLVAGLNAMGGDARRHIRPIALIAPSSAELLLSAGLDQAGWQLVADDDAQISARVGIQPGHVCLANSEGRRVWMGPAAAILAPNLLATVTTDALGGVDVPKQLMRQWEADEAAYRQKLDKVRRDAPDIRLPSHR